MDLCTAKILNQTTQAFYAAQASSFSATRQGAWPGWRRIVHGMDTPRSVLDVACGNLRFRRYVQEAFPGAIEDYCAVDTCEALAAAPYGVRFSSCDIVAALLSHEALIFDTVADLSVCFGFFHHVPGSAAREKLLRALVAATRFGGTVAVSLWRFMEHPALAEKAQVSHAAALEHFSDQGITLALDEHDYLLGWQRQQGFFRYAHHFTTQEADALIASVAECATLKDRFFSDGRTDDLNEYLVFRVK